MSVDVIACRGCGAVVGYDGSCPEAEHCGECPPWQCDGCGEMDSMARSCRCWIDLTRMALPELKYYMALGGMSIGTKGEAI